MIDIWSFFEQSANGLWHLLYPVECVMCGNPGAADQDLCPGCRRDLPWNLHACPRCALPLPAGAARVAACAGCQQNPPSYDHAWSAFRYTSTLRWLHRRLKFGKRLSNSGLLGNLLADALSESITQGKLAKPDRILVMPLHPRRLMRRGFNQSLELIRPTVRRLGIELDTRSLQRVRATRPQSDLPAGLRRRNVRGAFACGRDLSGLRLALFDDVVTTGHTVTEAARVLRRSGAEHISVWSLARTAESKR